MQPLYQADEQSVFHSPLGKYDRKSGEKWENMKQFLSDIMTVEYPHSKVIDPLSNRTLSYKELYENGEEISHQLKRQLGVCERSIVHIVSENGFDWLTILLASYLNDFIVSATHPKSPWPECERNIETTCSTVLIMSEKCYKRLGDDIKHPFLTHIIVMKSDSANNDRYEMSLEIIPQSHTRTPQYDPTELEDVCHFLLSSGTSGTPKPIKMGFRNLIDACLMSSAPGSVNLTSNDVVLVAQPLPHIGGIHFFFNSTIAGADIVVTDYPGADGILELIERLKLTVVFAVPSVLNRIAKSENLNQFDLSSLGYLITGTTNPTFETLEKIKTVCNNDKVRIHHAYGATEMYGIAFMTNDNFETNIESVGVALPGVRFKIADLKDPAKFITEPKLQGELYARQENFYPLYFNDAEKTKSSLTEDGFYKTGDLAYFDENFNLFICGRIKDVIKYRGLSISPAEIEEVIMKNPLVTDCSVVGQPDKLDGEIAVAFVVKSATAKAMDQESLESEIIRLVAKSVAAFKQIHNVYEMESIPRNGNGKVLKGELKELALTLYEMYD